MLGKMSYCFYLFHNVLNWGLLLGENSMIDYLSIKGLMIQSLIVIACCQPLVLCIHLMIETPILNIERHFEALKRKVGTKKPKIGSQPPQQQPTQQEPCESDKSPCKIEMADSYDQINQDRQPKTDESPSLQDRQPQADENPSLQEKV